MTGAKLMRRDEEPVDIGRFGYRMAMVVHQCTPWSRERLERSGATLAFARAALDLKAWRLVLTSNPDGSGARECLDIPEDMADLFPEGESVTLSFHKDKEYGFGTLVAVESHIPAPEMSKDPEP